MAQPELIAVFGPTGVGKTELVIALAKQLRKTGLDPVAISCDALQIYRGIELLTGVASSKQQTELEHRLVSLLEPQQSFSAGEYAELAHQQIDQLISEGRLPIVVGGTGLYLRAALTEMQFKPAVDKDIRSQLQQRLQHEGLPALYTELQQRSPQFADSINANDSQRTLRGLELLTAGIDPNMPAESELWSDTLRRPTLLVGLTRERQQLYNLIEQRVDQMIAEGATEQVLTVSRQQPSETVQKTLGFRELLTGDHQRMKTKTRQYARRQLTWMRKLPDLELINLTEQTTDHAVEQILARLKSS